MSGATVTPRRQSTFANTGVRMVPIGNGPRHKPWCRAIKTRATKRSIAFLVAEARPLTAEARPLTVEFSHCQACIRSRPHAGALEWLVRDSGLGGGACGCHCL